MKFELKIQSVLKIDQKLILKLNETTQDGSSVCIEGVYNTIQFILVILSSILLMISFVIIIQSFNGIKMSNILKIE